VSNPAAVGDSSEHNLGVRCYVYAGLGVCSEISLPEWRSFERHSLDGDPDVRITIDNAAADFPVPVGSQWITPDEYRSFVPGVGHFLVRNGCEVKVSPLQDTIQECLRPWLIGSIWGALCYQRGLFFVHASSVLIDDGAILLCARAKGGKSTLASHLNKMGHPLISDDLCHLVVPADGLPAVYPSAPRVKLWSDALDELGWKSESMVPDHAREGKFHIEREHSSRTDPVDVHGIFLLEWGDIEITRLSGLVALRRFLKAATYRPRLLQTERQVSEHAATGVRLLQRVPVWQLRRPRNLAMLADSTEGLLAHWARHRIMSG
jgi:hypothetical protein